MPLLSNMEFDRKLIAGLTAGKKWASGTTSDNRTVTGLLFTPSLVVCHYPYGGGYTLAIIKNPLFVTPSYGSHNTLYGYNSDGVVVNSRFIFATSTLLSDGFTITSGFVSTFNWIAYE